MNVFRQTVQQKLKMPASRRVGVKKVLAERVNKGEISAEDYKNITGEDYAAKSWPDLCESLLDRLEAKGENTTTERAEFGVLMWDAV